MRGVITLNYNDYKGEGENYKWKQGLASQIDLRSRQQNR